MLADQLHQSSRVNSGVLGKGNADLALLDADPANMQQPAQSPQTGNAPQNLYLFRRFAKTVDDLIQQVAPASIIQPRKAPVQLQLITGIGNIIVWDIAVNTDLQNRVRLGNTVLNTVLQLADRPLQHIAVSGKAHAGNMPMLLRSQQITCTADLQITHRDLKPGSQFCKVADRLQPFFSDLAQSTVPFIDKIGICQTGRTPYPPTHLIQL